MSASRDLQGNTIFNGVDDQGEPLLEGESYVLYPPPDELPFLGPLTAEDAVQLAGITAWYEWNDWAGVWDFHNAYGLRLELHIELYARRQS